jgi:hypothetical protein
MRQLLCWAVLASLSLAPGVWAADTPPKPATAPPIEQWIEQLGSNQYKVRQAATRALKQLGPLALPALRQARTNPDAEIHHRVEDLITYLEQTVALTPKRVTMSMEKKTIRAILTELARQSGYKIQAQDGPGNPTQEKAVYSFHFQDVPFWEALDKICEAGGLILQQTNGDDTLHLTFQDSYVPFKCYDGTFKVIATGFSFQRNKSFGQLPRNSALQGGYGWENLNINLLVAVEPRLPILKSGQVRITFAEDDEGLSVVPNGNNWWYNPWMWNNWNGGNFKNFFQNTQAWLGSPSKTARTIKVLKGAVPITLLAEQKPMVLTEKVMSAKGKEYKLPGGMKLKIDEFSTMGNKQHQVKITYSQENGDGNYDYNLIQSLQQRLELQDDKGAKYPSYININQWNGNNNAQFTLTTQPVNNNTKIGPPSKLVFMVWITLEHEVEFEFRGLPLP